MAFEIRKMVREDAERVTSAMRTFYASPAVSTNGSEEIFRADFEECVGPSPFATGFVFEENGSFAGYGMLTFGYSTEFGARCVWVEDIYVEEAFRGRGIAREFLSRVRKEYPGHLLRLEVEKENAHAVHVYRKAGFEELPYSEMIQKP